MTIVKAILDKTLSIISSQRISIEYFKLQSRHDKVFRDKIDPKNKNQHSTWYDRKFKRSNEQEIDKLNKEISELKDTLKLDMVNGNLKALIKELGEQKGQLAESHNVALKEKQI